MAADAHIAERVCLSNGGQLHEILRFGNQIGVRVVGTAGPEGPFGFPRQLTGGTMEDGTLEIFALTSSVTIDGAKPREIHRWTETTGWTATTLDAVSAYLRDSDGQGIEDIEWLADGRLGVAAGPDAGARIFSMELLPDASWGGGEVATNGDLILDLDSRVLLRRTVSQRREGEDYGRDIIALGRYNSIFGRAIPLRGLPPLQEYLAVFNGVTNQFSAAAFLQNDSYLVAGYDEIVALTDVESRIGQEGEFCERQAGGGLVFDLIRVDEFSLLARTASELRWLRIHPQLAREEPE